MTYRCVQTSVVQLPIAVSALLARLPVEAGTS